MIKKRMAAILLALVMLISLLPGMALAASDYTVSLSAPASGVELDGSIGVSVDVTSMSKNTYNAFYATLKYDKGLFEYDGDKSTLNSFSVDVVN